MIRTVATGAAGYLLIIARLFFLLEGSDRQSI
jgi:hypothetical protein